MSVSTARWGASSVKNHLTKFEKEQKEAKSDEHDKEAIGTYQKQTKRDIFDH